MAKKVTVSYCDKQTYLSNIAPGVNIAELQNITIDGLDPVVGQVFKFDHIQSGGLVITARARVTSVQSVHWLWTGIANYHDWPSNTSY